MPRFVFPVAYIWMLCGSLAFSFMAFLTHLLHDSFQWQTIAIVRTSISMLLALTVAIWGRTPLVIFKPATLWVRSIAGSIALLAVFYSLTHYEATEVQALTTMFPLWVALLSWPLLGETPSLGTWLAAGLGIAGAFLLQFPHMKEYGIGPPAVAILASLASAIALLGLHTLRGVGTASVVVHFSAVSLIFSILAVFFLPTVPVSATTVNTWGIVTLVTLGISATAGQLMLTKAFAIGPPAEVSVIGLAQVAFTMMFQILFQSRQFSLLSLLGFAMVLGPTAWVILYGKRNT